MEELKILMPGESGYGMLIERDAGYISPNLNKDLLIENKEIKLEPNKPLLINCVLQKWGVENKNGRIYPKEVLVPQINEYMKLVENNSGGGECFTPDTKILTKSGWKLIKNVSTNEEILTFNKKNKKNEYQKITKKIHEPYSGDMYHVKSDNVDLKVTPNHRFIIENSKGVLIEKKASELFKNIENNPLFNGENKILKNKKINNLLLKIFKRKRHFKLNSKIKVNKFKYSGDIVCVKVPNETIFVMRNGKSVWTLNSDHPDSSIISLHNLSHMITKMWWGTGDKEHILFGQIKLIITRGYINMGIVSVIGDKILLYLENGYKLGISSRGVGSLEEVNGKNIVQSDFELIGFDLVATPSTPGAYLFPGIENIEQSIGENRINKKGIYIKEENNKIIGAINKFLL